jgi:ClpP class serine protease
MRVRPGGCETAGGLRAGGCIRDHWELVIDLLSLLWLFFLLSSLQPLVQRQVLAARRRADLAQLSRKRQATVITMIHRQETMSLLGFPVVRYIDIDDAEGVLAAIRETPPGRAIEIILHTPGGLVLAASQIARALADHGGKVTAVIPHYAMSGGTLIALAADEIALDPHAVLGPVDPQLGQYPAAAYVAVAARPGDRDDETLLRAEIGRKAIVQVESFVRGLLERRLPAERAADVARILATGTWTHDHPLQVDTLQALGLPVSVGVDASERNLMRLYPQPRGRQSAVEYVPGPPQRPGLPPAAPMRRNARD